MKKLNWFDKRIKRYLCSIGFKHYYNNFIHGPADRLHWENPDNSPMLDTFYNTRSGHIYMGDGVWFGHNVMILTGRHIFENGKLKQPRSEQVPTEGYDIRIGAGCWLASRSIILGGVTLGEHCIVQGGAIVTKSFPAYSILAGIPAKKIGDTRQVGVEKQQ